MFLAACIGDCESALFSLIKLQIAIVTGFGV